MGFFNPLPRRLCCAKIGIVTVTKKVFQNNKNKCVFNIDLFGSYVKHGST